MSQQQRGRRTVMIRLDPELYQRLRAIIYHTGKDRSIQSLGHAAIRRCVLDIEALENGGKYFEPPALVEEKPPTPKRRK